MAEKRNQLISQIQELVDVQSRCSEQDWDGYGALPVSRSTLAAAVTLLWLLPDNVAAPEIVPEPSGEIGFLWKQGSDISFVVSVSPDALVFAGLLGSSNVHGESKFLGELPSSIQRTLSEYFSRSCYLD